MKKYKLYENRQLLELLSQSDELAFTELYHRYWKKLFALAYSYHKETQLSEDSVHDVFASLWKGRKHIKIEALENYLATAIKYLVLSKIRKSNRDAFMKKKIQQAPAVNLSAESALDYKHILEIIKTEVEKLPEKCKVIFKCSREEGMPVKLIAKELNISPKTVENQLTKALRHLKLATRSFLSTFL